MANIKLFTALILSSLFLSCTGHTQQITELTKDPQFGEHWYKGQAELTSYKLEQARYGEIHSGNAVLIFVTEDFSQSKQVKLNNPGKNPSDVVPVLKLNQRREFNTGIYPYALMTSVFTPVELSKQSRSLKVATSAQEWCGHTFMQFNKIKDSYKATGFSYFESEGDQIAEVKGDLLEDELWTRIRINPKSLPIGTFNVIPSQLFLRLRHTPLRPYKAVGSIVPSDDGREMTYVLKYTELQRELRIQFESAFPYQINGWTEKYKSGFGTYAEVLETKATLNKRLWTDYWRQNSVSDLTKSRDLMEGTE